MLLVEAEQVGDDLAADTLVHTRGGDLEVERQALGDERAVAEAGHERVAQRIHARGIAGYDQFGDGLVEPGGEITDCVDGHAGALRVALCLGVVLGYVEGVGGHHVDVLARLDDGGDDLARILGGELLMVEHLTGRAAPDQRALKADHRIGGVQKVGEAAGRDEHAPGGHDDGHARGLQRGDGVDRSRQQLGVVDDGTVQIDKDALDPRGIETLRQWHEATCRRSATRRPRRS